ncbi:lysine decarboxylase-like protein [Diplocarpon rosae]|nr:lysine decarboxylase-like protein [Diplocarpon rosae]
MASGDASPSPLGSDSLSSITNAIPHGLSNLNPASILSTNNDENLAPGRTPSTTETGAVPKTKICVFCGASPGNSPAHMEAARAIATAFHAHNISLVYGGGTVGLMGEIARTLVSLSGPSSVHGIIPAPLVKYERGPNSSTSDVSSGELPEYEVYGKTTVVKDMHTRKQLMAREIIASGPGSGFIALPGGYGTLEELMEVVTWNQLGIHDRGVVVLNVDRYWDGLLAWIRDSVAAGFVGAANQGIIREAKSAEEAVALLRGYRNVAGRFKLEWGSE